MMVLGVFMDEYVIKQKIQRACIEPPAPKELTEKVILRARAVTMGVQALKQLEGAPAEEIGLLASRVLVGQLAAVSELPMGAQPEGLARNLSREPAFAAALRGGNVARRLSSGELLRQLTGQRPTAEQAPPQTSASQKEGPTL